MEVFRCFSLFRFSLVTCKEESMKIKKFLVSSVVLIALTLSTTAFAQVKEFGPASHRFSLDIPDGWTANPVDGSNGSGVVVTNKKQDTVLFICIVNNTGETFKEIIERIGKQFDIKNLVIKKEDNNGCIAAGMLDNLPVGCTVNPADGKFMVSIIGGEDKKTLNKIVDSFE